jgi:hypothetical protein
MLKHIMFALMVAGTACFALSPGMAGDEKSPKKLESKKEAAEAIPDFAKAFSTGLESNGTLASRLKQARFDGQPLTLALIAKEIQVNETVSGKKASITAEAVQKEAVELAKLRLKAAELKAIALFTQDKDLKKELSALAKKASEDESERIALFKSSKGEMDTRGPKHLRVNNNTEVRVHIRANGHHLGWVEPFSVYTFNTPFLHSHHVVNLRAHDQYGDVWRSHTIQGPHIVFDWYLSQ